MGLSIEVGCLGYGDVENEEFFLDELERLNELLIASGLRAHQENRDCPLFSADLFGYEALHRLRRLAAHLNLRGGLPEPDGEFDPEDPVVLEYYELADAPSRSLLSPLFPGRRTIRKYDHLMLHSDADGYYVPQDFRNVLEPPEDLEITGKTVGSSVRLLEEMKTISKALSLPLDIGADGPELWAAAEGTGSDDTLWKLYGIESHTCLQLYTAAEHSVEHSALLVFT